jgi:hypothetical protein
LLLRFGRTDPAWALGHQEKDLTCESRFLGRDRSWIGTQKPIRFAGITRGEAPTKLGRIRTRRASPSRSRGLLFNHRSMVGIWGCTPARCNSYRRREHILAAFPNCLLAKEEKSDELG